MQQRQENAAQSLIEFLQKNENIIVKDVSVTGEFDYKDLHYYILKYIPTSLDDKFLLGVCGGYFEDEAWHCGYVSGSHEYYSNKTAPTKAKQIVDRLIEERVKKREINLATVPPLTNIDFKALFSAKRREKSLITESLYQLLDNLMKEGYFNAILGILTFGIEAGFYTRKEMEKDLDSALFSAYVLLNTATEGAYEESERLLTKTWEEGEKNGVWCYRYSVSLMCNKRFLKSYEYAKKSIEVAPEYPWGYLQLASIAHKLGNDTDALKAVARGLELVPHNEEFLAIKKEIEEAHK